MKNLAHICSGKEFPDGPNGLKDVKLKDLRFYAHTIEDAARKLQPETILIARDAVYDAKFEERIRRLHREYSCVEVTGQQLREAFLPPLEILKNYDKDGLEHRTYKCSTLGCPNDEGVVAVPSYFWTPTHIFGIPCETVGEQNKILSLWIPAYDPVVSTGGSFYRFVDDNGKVPPSGYSNTRDGHNRVMITLSPIYMGHWFAPFCALPPIPEERAMALMSNIPFLTLKESEKRFPVPMHPEYRTEKASITELNQCIGPLFLV